MAIYSTMSALTGVVEDAQRIGPLTYYHGRIYSMMSELAFSSVDSIVWGGAEIRHYLMRAYSSSLAAYVEWESLLVDTAANDYHGGGTGLSDVVCIGYL